ncbi:Crp/Fnr family transcriptional regulator [Acidovorax sp. M2(2025)]|uniref:Crp/Fnr family transcriptional regulator n=1 Tax=Acidovorax sp. M2(2025) TaxID=3411355 RepID=UPI003BF50ACA
MRLTPDSLSETLVRRLRSCRLFDGMDDARLAEVARLCSWQNLQPGQIAAGCSQGTFFIVCHGRMRVSALAPNGRELLLADFERGAHFGGISVLGASAATLQAQALDASLLACLEREDFMQLLRQDAVLGGQLVEALRTVTEQLVSRVIELGILKIPGRLCSHLLELAKAAGVQDNQATIEPAPRHVDLAARIAASREEVSRELARLRQLGLVTSTRQKLVVQDVEALEQRLLDL